LRFSADNLARYEALDPVALLMLRSAALDGLPPGPAEVSLWADEVASAAERRHVERLLVEASRRLDKREDTAAWLAEQLLALRRGSEEEGFEVALEEALRDVLEQPFGVSTGLGALDLALNGLVAGNLVILGGRPGQGKTSLALGMATHQALHLGLQVQFFSLEMTRAELALRQVCCLADISATALKRRELDEKDWLRLEWAAKKMETLPLAIDDSGSLTVAELIARARSGGARAVYVDYAQLLAAEGFKRDDLRGSMTHISKSLKGLAKSMKVPVVLLSQLRRPGAGQRDSRPSMHDLKESSGLEQDADAVLLIWQPEEMRSTGRAELIVEKNRHGEACDLSLGFVGETTSFVNLEMA
jgi:replicative DNA helicase